MINAKEANTLANKSLDEIRIKEKKALEDSLDVLNDLIVSTAEKGGLTIQIQLSSTVFLNCTPKSIKEHLENCYDYQIVITDSVMQISWN